MKLLPEYVFISYAHLDNRPDFDEVGWVSQFRMSFSAILSKRLGHNADPIIWRDTEKLQGNSDLTSEIRQGLASSALLISVLSPSYVKSEWCRKELHAFCELANRSGGLLVDNKARVLKVVKLPPDSLEILPPPLRGVLDYPFFKEEHDGYQNELDPCADRDQFRDAIMRLAADAARLIRELQAGSVAEGPAQATPIRIYLADCTYDLRETRERLAADLKQSGCLVFPDKPLPAREQSEYCTAVRQACQECDLAIHMIGSRYGTIPETIEPQPRSVVELQNVIAAELAGSVESGRGLRRLIWLPAHLPPGDALQRSFVERLDQEADLQVGADLIRGDFEELRTTLHRMIRARREALALAVAPRSTTDEQEGIRSEPTGKPMVYVVCTQDDLKQAVPLRKWLRQQGCDVELPVFEGDATALRSANQELLRACSAVIHFYGTGTDRWLRSVRSDLRKLNIYRQGLPPIPRGLYLADPDTPLKQDHLDDPDDDYTDVIDARQGFEPTSWGPFVQAVQAGSQPHA